MHRIADRMGRVMGFADRAQDQAGPRLEQEPGHDEHEEQRPSRRS